MLSNRSRNPLIAAGLVLFCIWLYWDGLHVWFVQDDFAWLGLRLEVHRPSDLLRILFEPKAQGSIRPVSERGFFLVFERLFGFNALPWRAAVLFTQCANVLLLWSIARRLAGSQLAGVAAAVFWAVNIGLAVPMSWTSAYNEVLLACCFLGGFRLWLEYTSTGRRRWLAGQWAVFLLGFGVLELNVVYPALVAAHALLATRERLRQTVPMLAVSAVYAAAHRWSAPKAAGPYAMHWDFSIFVTLADYLNQITGLAWLRTHGWPAALVSATVVALWAALAVFVVVRLRRGCGLVLLGPVWLLVTLAPVLPLRDHITAYYLTVPAIGLALTGGFALRAAIASRRIAAVAVAAVLGGTYLFASAASLRDSLEWQRGRSRDARELIGSIARARRLHPNGMLILRRLSAERFWAAIYDDPLRLAGIKGVYLDPENEIASGEAALRQLEKFVVPEAVLARALQAGEAQVYDASAVPLRNITAAFRRAYLAVPRAGLPLSADLGDPAFAFVLGDGWYPAEGGYRWMGKRGTLRLAAPNAPRAILELSGYALPQLTGGEGYSLQVRVNGRVAGNIPIGRSDPPFTGTVPFETQARGGELDVEIESSRSLRPPGDARELSAAFGRIAVR